MEYHEDELDAVRRGCGEAGHLSFLQRPLGTRLKRSKLDGWCLATCTVRQCYVTPRKNPRWQAPSEQSKLNTLALYVSYLIRPPQQPEGVHERFNLIAFSEDKTEAQGECIICSRI